MTLSEKTNGIIDDHIEWNKSNSTFPYTRKFSERNTHGAVTPWHDKASFWITHGEQPEALAE